MFIPENIKDRYSAGDAWLKAKLAKEEITLPDYPRPLVKMKIKRSWSLAACYGFAGGVVKSMLP